MLELLIAASYTVLHSSLEKSSRDFISAIPGDKQVQVIDWYQDESSRYAYTGPPPSAFPTVIIDLPADKRGTVRQPTSWSEVEAAESDNSRCETVAEDNEFIGGVALSNVMPLLKSGVMTTREEVVLRATVEELKAAIDRKMYALQTQNLVNKDQAQAVEILRDIASKASLAKSIEKSLEQ